MTTLQDLTEEFGINPYAFFWILQHDATNPNLNAQHQREVWKNTLKDFDWFKPFLVDAELIMITDNGDLVFALPNGTFCCNPRSDEYELYPIAPAQFLRSCRTLNSRILPPDLQ